MTATEYVLEDFVADLRRIVGASEDEATILVQVQPLARRFAGERSWLREAMYGADPALGFGTTLLHAEVDHSLFVVVDSWLPGRGVPPHDHATWAVVVGVDGSERNIFWQRLDDATRPGYAELQRIGEQSIGPGQTLAMPSGSIHSVINETPHTSLSFHVYGRHLNHTARRQFDPEHNRERPFIIDAR
jgi:predicted metal-dependent enzyme (double-stranded beta helix superfamily)